jgi:ribosomal protein S28E/S33
VYLVGQHIHLTYVRDAAHFSQSASTLMTGDTGLTFQIWQRVIKERQKKKLYQRDSFGTIKAADRMCVWSAVTSSDSTTSKEDH